MRFMRHARRRALREPPGPFRRVRRAAPLRCTRARSIGSFDRPGPTQCRFRAPSTGPVAGSPGVGWPARRGIRSGAPIPRPAPSSLRGVRDGREGHGSPSTSRPFRARLTRRLGAASNRPIRSDSSSMVNPSTSSSQDQDVTRWLGEPAPWASGGRAWASGGRAVGERWASGGRAVGERWAGAVDRGGAGPPAGPAQVPRVVVGAPVVVVGARVVVVAGGTVVVVVGVPAGGTVGGGVVEGCDLAVGRVTPADTGLVCRY